MKKRIVMLMLTLMISVSSLTGCGNKTQITQSSTDADNSTTVGNYFLYETSSRQEYLSFLETLDESKYEIIDISIGYYGQSITGQHINHYNVTYRVIEE